MQETETETPKAAYVLISKDDIRRLRRVEIEGRLKHGCTNHFIVVCLNLASDDFGRIDWEKTE
jgi:hypothetical protein